MQKYDKEEFMDNQVLLKAGECGFGGIYVTEFGGSGLSRKDASIIFETLSTGCVATSAYISIHNMCVWMMHEFARKELKERFLNDLIQFKLKASYCLTEPNSGSDAASLSTTAVLDGQDYVLNGAKAFISNAGESDLYVVMARTSNDGPKGITCLVVPKDATGLSFGKKEEKLGWNAQPTRAVFFQDCRIPSKNVLGKVGEGFKIAMKGLDGGRVNIASCSLGGATAALQEAMDHVKVRKQFNQPIAAFQNTQFKIAEMAMDLNASRVFVRQAADALDNRIPEATAVCAMAKAFATEKCYDITNTALQLFGGYGYLKDYKVQQYMRDLRVHMILEGTNEVMRMIAARHLLSK